MMIQTTAQLLYILKTYTTAVYLLFEGEWWRKFLRRVGVEYFTRLVEESHNELKTLVEQGVIFTYNPFYSAEKNHWYFDDPKHQCQKCRGIKFLRPSLKNRVLNKLGFKKYRHIMFINV